jgi:hypothetical protein
VKVGASVELRHLAPEEAILSHATIHHFPTHHLPLTTYNLQLTTYSYHLALEDAIELPAARDDDGRNLLGHTEADPSIVQGNERRLGVEGSVREQVGRSVG